jgi:hypothetical protein
LNDTRRSTTNTTNRGCHVCNASRFLTHLNLLPAALASCSELVVNIRFLATTIATMMTALLSFNQTSDDLHNALT